MFRFRPLTSVCIRPGLPRVVHTLLLLRWLGPLPPAARGKRGATRWRDSWAVAA
jgi:hypothetical protein